MTNLEKYVHHYCSRELKETQNRLVGVDQLSFEEQALIYKYTEDGYEAVNEKLRITKGKGSSDFGKFLDRTLAKLPNYEDIAYRAANLTAGELQRYLDAKANDIIIIEYPFISASKSKMIANQFRNNCQFRVFSRSGKDIEAFAKYGTSHPQNEKEILFRPNCKFRVLEVTKQGHKTLITLLEEVK